jgi:two-component system, OmpR family, KDP operon response regulator KdpE
MAQPPLVLIVDDDQMLRDMLRDLLDDVGYRTVTASNGAAGLDTLRRAAPDLVLLDVAMPVMDGLTFLRRRSAEDCRPTVPIVVMSAQSREAEARLLGAQQFVSKPFDLDNLLDVVDRCLHPPAS